MSQSLITFRAARDNFFDRALVQREVGRESARALSRIGAWIRTDMRRSIRPARRMKLSDMSPGMREAYKDRPAKERPFASSLPGEPPRGRTKRLKTSILYVYDPRSESVVAGPTLFPGSRSSHAPRTLEEGGRSFVRAVKATRKSDRRATPEQRKGFLEALAAGKIKRDKPTILEIPVFIKPRPYVAPSLKKNLSRIPREFRNLIRHS